MISIIPDNNVLMNLRSNSGSLLGFVCLFHCDVAYQGELLGTFNQSHLKVIIEVSTAFLVRIIKFYSVFV